jgi:putative aminopeptidase FrvX
LSELPIQKVKGLSTEPTMKNDPSKRITRPPKISGPQIQLLERLCNACGVSGNEKEIRLIVLDQIKRYADQIEVDALGNVLAICKGSGEPRLRVMIAAHMDEVGMMITNDEGDGIFRFDVVGSINPRILAGKPVWIGSSHLPGVIGIKPIHLASSDMHQVDLSVEDMRIDVSPDRAKMVKVGDSATFAYSFTRLGPSLRAKAMDDRIGVATLIEIIRSAPANIDLLAAFTVQEEIGARGAHIAAYKLDPDIAFVLDSTPAMDLPTYHENETGDRRAENSRYNTRLGSGPAIYIADRSTISDPRLVSHLIQTGQALNIPFQLRQPGGGGTDAGAIHKQRLGIPSISVSVPGRYPHTGATIVRLKDWMNTIALVYHALERISPNTLSVER